MFKAGLRTVSLQSLCETQTAKRNMNEYYPLVNIQKAIEHGPFVDGLSIMNGDFPWLY